MRRLPALAAAGLLAAGGGAWAQTVQLEPSAVVRCLRLEGPGDPVPAYPEQAWKRGTSATVRVSLRFDAPDRAPSVQLGVEGGDPDAADFEASVRDHVARLRAPCLTPDRSPAQLSQVYEFRPDDRRIHWSRPSDAADAARGELLKCVVHTRQEKNPVYPSSAQREGLRGRVLAEVVFEAPDRPPGVTLHARPAARPLTRAVEAWLADLRMPCHTGAPVRSQYSFVFVLGDERYGMLPMTLNQLLANVRGLPQRGLKLDTREMGCPFDLEFKYLRPALPNRVGERGQSLPARRPLLEWLEDAEIAAPAATLDAIFADTTTVTVPCIQFDIPPQEKSS